MNTRHTEKEIGYAYPSSIWAIECGFNKTGCYCLRLVSNGGDTHVKMLGGFPLFSDAQIAADTLPQAYSRWTMKEQAAALSAQSCEVCATS